ncbi:hypothetical protein SNEBB_002603 [Seison nebaliae]|nr:hypothetical protein SNEBB_002603 [Seison nebaliae]
MILPKIVSFNYLILLINIINCSLLLHNNNDIDCNDNCSSQQLLKKDKLLQSLLMRLSGGIGRLNQLPPHQMIEPKCNTLTINELEGDIKFRLEINQFNSPFHCKRLFQCPPSKQNHHKLQQLILIIPPMEIECQSKLDWQLLLVTPDSDISFKFCPSTLLLADNIRLYFPSGRAAVTYQLSSNGFLDNHFKFECEEPIEKTNEGMGRNEIIKLISSKIKSPSLTTTLKPSTTTLSKIIQTTKIPIKYHYQTQFIRSHCSPYPCLNNADGCINLSNTFICLCNDAYRGERCELLIEK